MDGQTITANVGNLVYGKQATITFTVQVNETTEENIINTATATSTNQDPIAAYSEVTILYPTLTIAKYVGTQDQPIDVSIAEQQQVSAQVGQDVDYKIIVEQTTEGAVARTR